MHTWRRSQGKPARVIIAVVHTLPRSRPQGNRIVVRRPAYAVASATKRDFCGLAKRAAIDVILVHDKERFTSATVHIASLSDVGDKGEFSIVLEEDLDDVDSKVLGRRGAAGELDSMHTQMSVEARISQCLSSDTHKVAIALAVDDEGVPKPIPQGKIDYRSIGMLLAVVLYFAMGLIFYTQHEGWTFTDSLYFCMVTVTTVGYGDQGSFYADGATSTAITDSDEAMLFTAFFVAYGIGVISVCLSYAIEKLMAAKDAAMHALQESALDALLDEDVDDEADDEETNRKEEAEEKAAKSSMAFVSTALSWLVVLVIFGLGILVMTLEEPATNRFVHALYWLVITGTTVGYGDLGPTTDGGKWFCIFYLLLLTATVAKLVSDFADWVTKEDEAAKNVKKDMRFSEELLQALDLNGDKRIMKWEWLAGMLVRLQYVKPDAVARILVHFDKSNIDGDDELDIDDLRPTKARKERLVRRSMAQQAPVELRDGGDDDPELMSVESSLKDVAKVCVTTKPTFTLYAPQPRPPSPCIGSSRARVRVRGPPGRRVLVPPPPPPNTHTYTHAHNAPALPHRRTHARALAASSCPTSRIIAHRIASLTEPLPLCISFPSKRRPSSLSRRPIESGFRAS